MLEQPVESDAEPWDLDVDELLALEELVYLLQTLCVLPCDESNVAGVRYLTPSERQLALAMPQA